MSQIRGLAAIAVSLTVMTQFTTIAIAGEMIAPSTVAAEPTNTPPRPMPEPGATVPAHPVAPGLERNAAILPSRGAGLGTSRPGISEEYTLGAGDVIYLDIFNVPEHSGEKRVLVDGSVSLSWVGNVLVKGMTLEQAAAAIAAAYRQTLRNPVVTVSLVAARPLQVSIAGAVNRPGSYAIDFAETGTGTGGAAERRWPTVTQALQSAGGITQVANVRQVTVQRVQPGGTTQAIQVDLWELLQSGNLQQDLTLRDGDSIFVPTATQINPTEVSQLAIASFSPATIRVNVVGEVAAPGVVEVPPNTPLTQALLAAGGFDNSRAQTGTVELVRLNPDGTVSQRQIPVSFNQGISEESNPILYPNDVIIVQRSGGARFSDAANGILGTLGMIFPFFDLFID